MTGKGN